MDGSNGEFNKSCLRIVSSDVINVIHLFFLHGNSNLEAINLALLIPNPKVVAAQEVIEYRPINLYNEIYKIISKISG